MQETGEAISTPGSGRSPGGVHGNPTPVFLPGEFHGPRSQANYSPQGRAEYPTLELRGNAVMPRSASLCSSFSSDTWTPCFILTTSSGWISGFLVYEKRRKVVLTERYKSLSNKGSAQKYWPLEFKSWENWNKDGVPEPVSTWGKEVIRVLTSAPYHLTTQKTLERISIPVVCLTRFSWS